MGTALRAVAAPAPACRIGYRAVPATDCWMTGSASMSAARCDDHLAGKDGHNNGHEMTPGGLPASLPGRPTDSLERGQDLAGAGLVVGGARGAVPLVSGGVSSDLSSTTGMVLGTNIDNL